MLQVNLEEAKGRLPELVNAVLKGETVLIVKDLQAIVQLAPVISSMRRQFGSAKELIVMADNFDAPLPDFNPYMP
ncbi:MAG: prevent-host-death protein [Candidatus Hydrogenedentota bacterium]|nr:MAG: prevent-host-death protein [Candidatus Hydrogenedentota bacterium]